MCFCVNKEKRVGKVARYLPLASAKTSVFSPQTVHESARRTQEVQTNSLPAGGAGGRDRQRGGAIQSSRRRFAEFGYTNTMRTSGATLQIVFATHGSTRYVPICRVSTSICRQRVLLKKRLSLVITGSQTSNIIYIVANPTDSPSR